MSDDFHFRTMNMPAASDILAFDRSYAADRAAVRDAYSRTREREETRPAFADSLERARQDDRRPAERAGRPNDTGAPPKSSDGSAGTHEPPRAGGITDKEAAAENRGEDGQVPGAQPAENVKQTVSARDTAIAAAAAAAGQGTAITSAGAAATPAQPGGGGGGGASASGAAAAPNAAAQAIAAAAQKTVQGEAPASALPEGELSEAEPDILAIIKPLNGKTGLKQATSISANVAKNALANAAAAASASPNLQALQSGTGGAGAGAASHSTIIQAMDSQMPRGFAFADPAAFQQTAPQPEQPIQTALPQQSAQPTVQSSQTAQTFQAHLQPQMPQNAAPAAQQLSVSIVRGAREGADKIDIQLHPAELGRVEVKLELGHDGRIMAVVSAERAETLEQLRRDVNQLEKALADAGFDTDRDSFTFQDRRDREGGGEKGDGPAGEKPGERIVPDTILTSAGRQRLSLDGLGIDLSV
ncbi:hypothetical protein CVT23_17295 [Minwuia thermotolerans]|uniref:Flagellar hook-length control protein-like C-terminal domain-containing protein n=2 Tax=Minwuia thermotolerans TaxID=2056226 RepID=A0A2M9FYC1_9PROT|nr:hypothetical protein CVT23_17295 [Minwuia thermotolerans]